MTTDLDEQRKAALKTTDNATLISWLMEELDADRRFRTPVALAYRDEILLRMDAYEVVFGAFDAPKTEPAAPEED